MFLIQFLFLQIRGTPWTTDYNDRRTNVTNLDTFLETEVEDSGTNEDSATCSNFLQLQTAIKLKASEVSSAES